MPSTMPSTNTCQLVDVGLVEPLEEPVDVVAVDAVAVQTQHWRVAGVADQQRSLAAEDLGANVVAEAGAAAVVDHAEAVVAETERDHARVDVAEFLEHRRDEGAPHREDLAAPPRPSSQRTQSKLWIVMSR